MRAFFLSACISGQKEFGQKLEIASVTPLQVQFSLKLIDLLELPVAAGALMHLEPAGEICIIFKKYSRENMLGNINMQGKKICNIFDKALS